MRKDYIPQDSHKDLNFKLKYNGKSRQIKFDRCFLFISKKACIDIFKGSIF